MKPPGAPAPTKPLNATDPAKPSALQSLLHGDRLDQLDQLDLLLELPSFAPDMTSAGTDERSRRTYRRLCDLARAGGGTLAFQQDRASLLTALEWAATADPALFLPALVHFAVVATTVVELGRPGGSLGALIEDLDRTAAIGVIAITELGSGSSHIAPATEAHYDHQRRTFTLRTPHPAATKFMPPTALPKQSKIAVVYARLLIDGHAHGVFPFAVRLRHNDTVTAGVRISAIPTTSVLPLDYALIGFEDVQVPYDAWLRDTARITVDGRFEDPIADQELRLVRSIQAAANASVSAAVGQAAAARAAMAVALRYALQRTTQGRLAPELSVLEYSTHQDALYSALARCYATTFLVNEERERFVRRGPSAAPAVGDRPPTWAPWSATHRDCALAKAWAGDTLHQVAGVCRKRSGAQGTLSVNRITDYEDIARLFHAAGGDDLLIRLDAGKSLLHEPSPGPDEPTSSPPSPYGPPERPEPPEAPFPYDLSDPRTAIRLARLRRHQLHAVLTAHLAAQVAAHRAESATPHPAGTPPPDSLDIWNPLLPGLVRLAEAHTGQLALERFQQQAETLTDPQAHAALTALLRLFALDSIEAELGWHLEHGNLTPAQAGAVHQARTQALGDVHRQLPELLDGLGVPTHRAPAPIAEPDWLHAFLRAATPPSQPT
ncbi:acyl-CoA dehydrogenase family protein [Kitasatospora mediocidica]|uniref:acyl-CoA dehydrogenase family protein n=1 Tax=Kitasatospora mediocidica TaxID=58352 RepID=UPI000565619C|nr:acyl-CoA dehydrogenase [Kitasatospora mediocidica]